MKKKYIIPEICVTDFKADSLLVGSPMIVETDTDQINVEEEVLDGDDIIVY